MLRRLNVVEKSRKDHCDINDFESVLYVDDDDKFFSITQFDRYIWRSAELSHLGLYDYACCNTKVRKKPDDREPKPHAGR